MRGVAAFQYELHGIFFLKELPWCRELWIADLSFFFAVSCVLVVSLVAAAIVLRFSITMDSMQGAKLSPVYARGP